jgi:hypothetical protein
MNRIAIGLALAMGAAVLATAVEANSVAQKQGEVSFSRDVQPLLSERCTMCHRVDDHMGELVLEPGYAYQQLVNAPSIEAVGMARIAAGKPSASYLMHKLDGTHVEAGGFGWTMPPPTNPTLHSSPAHRELIRRWIAQGANNN